MMGTRMDRGRKGGRDRERVGEVREGEQRGGRKGDREKW